MYKVKNCIRFNKKTGGIVALVLLVIIAFAGGSSEFQITTNESDQQYPTIFGDIVVWEDGRNRNNRPKLSRISNKKRATDESVHQWLPLNLDWISLVVRHPASGLPSPIQSLIRAL